MIHAPGTAVRLVAPAIALLLSLAPANAETLSITCPEGLDGSPTTVAYEGSGSGTLSARGAFGEIKLPATRIDKDSNVGGQKFKVIGIQARGAATVLMPDKAKLESCLTGKGANPKDANNVAYLLHQCQFEVAPAKEPVAIDAEVTVTIIDLPDADVFITRTFRAESAVAGGRMRLESLPPLSCEVK